MARTRKTDLFFEDPTQAEIDIDDFLEEWGPQTSIVEIYQMMRDGSRPHQERVGMEVLKDDLYGYLREKLGPGKYLLQFKDGSRKIRKSLLVAVGAGERTLTPAAPVASTTPDYMKELLPILLASLKPPDMGSLMQGIAAMMASTKPASNDPSAMLTAVVGAFSALKSAMGSSEDGLERFQKMIAMVKDIMPEGSKEENMYTVVKDVGTKLLETLKPKQNGNGMPSIYPVPQVAATTVPALPSPEIPPTPTDTPDDMFEKWLRAQIGFLKQKAAAGKAVENWIDYVFDNQEEPGCNAILAAMERGVTFDHLLQFDPEIRDNPILNSWFRKFYDAVHAEIRTSLDPTGAGGNAPDAGNHAPTGTPGSVDTGSAKPRKSTAKSP